MISSADNPKSQRDALLPLLHASRERFLSSFAGMTEEDARIRPDENCWSALDCVEHICTAEEGMLWLLIATQRQRPADAPNREQLFSELMGSRERRVESPEIGRPRGRFPSLAAASQHFQTARAATIRFVEENTSDLRTTEVTHPHPLVGVVSSYEMVIIMARHAERHGLQIQEVRNSPRFQESTATRS